MAQNFTNFLPAGSIPAHISQIFTNLVKTLTDTSVTSSLSFVADPTSPVGGAVDLDAHMGLPLALAFDALGAPVSTLSAFGMSATTFINAVQAGNPLGAAAAILDAPAVVLNGFLNGQATFPLTLNALGIQTTLNIPMDGIVVPPAAYTASTAVGIPGVVTGTPLSGIIPGLLNFLPESLAAALGGPVPVIPNLPQLS